MLSPPAALRMRSLWKVAVLSLFVVWLVRTTWWARKAKPFQFFSHWCYISNVTKTKELVKYMGAKRKRRGKLKSMVWLGLIEHRLSLLGSNTNTVQGQYTVQHVVNANHLSPFNNQLCLLWHLFFLREYVVFVLVTTLVVLQWSGRVVHVQRWSARYMWVYGAYQSIFSRHCLNPFFTCLWCTSPC